MAHQNVSGVLAGMGLMDCLQYYDNCLFLFCLCFSIGFLSHNGIFPVYWEVRTVRGAKRWVYINLIWMNSFLTKNEKSINPQISKVHMSFPMNDLFVWCQSVKYKGLIYLALKWFPTSISLTYCSSAPKLNRCIGLCQLMTQIILIKGLKVKITLTCILIWFQTNYTTTHWPTILLLTNKCNGLSQ
jgi:hypothetical protein